ncbi:MAG: shikimate kinase [Chitinophagaceae bacterium]|nr:MAG: shikimate kinase [Chitinophagaceae bacterium]
MDISIQNDSTHSPIFLVGFMGSGKTHWGRQWAAVLHRKFIDVDELIETQEQLSVTEIFSSKGEAWFREKEALVLRSVIDKNDLLVSCGGGLPCFHDNMNFMNSTGTTIYLQASPRFLLHNILKEPQARPLLKNMNEAEMLFFIETKLNERNPCYKQATFILNAEDLTGDSIKIIPCTKDY